MVRIQETSLDGERYLMGYRVLTEDMRSLGLRNNPNIMTYKVGEWIMLPEDKIAADDKDWGGIWVCRTPGSARGLMKYMMRYHGTLTRSFTAALKSPLLNSESNWGYRMKTSGIYLMEEVKLISIDDLLKVKQ